MPLIPGIAINDLGLWRVGQLSPQWEIPLVRDTRTFDLTGVTLNLLNLLIYNSAKVQIGTGGGSIFVNNVVPAVITYTQVAADVANVGTFYFRICVNFNGNAPDYSDYIHIQIQS